jgi:hypothetical protein
VCFMLQERLEELIADGAKVEELEILPIHRSVHVSVYVCVYVCVCV